MPRSKPAQNPADVARRVFYLYVVLGLIGLVCGPLFVFRGIHANRRDRPSLQWPKTTGTLMQCDEIYHPGGRHSSGTYSITATYTYSINEQRYVEHQITLWSPDLRGRTGDFAARHRVPSPVDVYYDPQNLANAVLIPGADEWLNRLSIIDGGVLFAVGMLAVLLLPLKFAKYKTQLQLGKSGAAIVNLEL